MVMRERRGLDRSAAHTVAVSIIPTPTPHGWLSRSQDQSLCGFDDRQQPSPDGLLCRTDEMRNMRIFGQGEGCGGIVADGKQAIEKHHRAAAVASVCSQHFIPPSTLG